MIQLNQKNILHFDIKGAAVPKQSAKFANRGGGVRSYQPQKVLNYEKKVKETFEKKYPEHDILEYTNVPLLVTIKVYFEIPKSKSKMFKMNALEGKIRPLCRPDTDNLSKGIKDALNGVLWADDKQVVQETIEKWYAEQPYAEVFVCKI